MARIESQAVAGYYPKPSSQVPRIAALLKVEDREDEAYADLSLALCDPVAGEGAAVEQLARLLLRPVAEARHRLAVLEHEERVARWREKYPDDKEYPVPPPDAARLDDPSREVAGAAFYTVELEETRHKVLSERPGLGYHNRQRALRGDAHCVPFTRDEDDGGVGLLDLNPPYDLDKVCGRLEEKFLRRFTAALATGGVLVFTVPYYALSASAETLARCYEDVSCHRLAGADFDAFKQVVVLARRLPVDRLEPDPEILALANEWAANVLDCPELPDPAPYSGSRLTVPLREGDALEGWEMRQVDATAVLAEYRPWHESTRRGGVQPLARVVPQFPLVDVMHRTYEVATSPRPAHIAAGLAAGIFNGQRIEPDDPLSKFPPLLVKGVFDREWKTVEEKENKDGEKTGEVQVQAPRLVVTVLDLKHHTYHQVRQEAAASEETPTRAGDLSVGDLLAHYGRSLMEVMDRQCVVLYDPRRDEGKRELTPSLRTLFKAQSRAAEAILTVLDDRGGVRQPILIGEIGCLRGDTPIHDPVSGRTLTVATRHRRGEAFHVWARGDDGYPVVAVALPPVKYPTAEMVRVTLSDGSSIVVTPAHRFWDGVRWARASDVAEEVRRYGKGSLVGEDESDLKVRAGKGAGGTRWTGDHTIEFREEGSRKPVSSSATTLRNVVSVEPVDAESYYDFHVPVFNNYWAVGLWHHNSGKSTVSLVAARSRLDRVGRREGRVLVFCPPHLLDGWRNEVAAVYPDADYRVLTSVSEVDAVAAAPPGKFVVAVVSREAAKLGHRLEGVAGTCPKCGRSTHDAPDELAKKRARCGRRPARPENKWARLARALALRLRAFDVQGVDRHLPRMIRGDAIAARRGALKMSPVDPPAYAAPIDLLREVREAVVEAVAGCVGHDSPLRRALFCALAAEGAPPEVVLAVARRLKPEHYDYNRTAESVLLFLPPGGALGAAHELLATFPAASYAYGSREETSAQWFQKQYAKVRGPEGGVGGVEVAGYGLRLHDDGALHYDGHALGSVEAAAALLQLIGSIGVWSEGEPCGEPLYQSTPDPRRYPLAKYIVKRHRGTFDFVIIDEAHEASSSDAAQTIAAHRLTALGLPTLLMTGSVMNGYAESLFANFWATDREFREEFDRREVAAFVDRYGYRKRFVSDREEGKVVAFGTQSDRVERCEKDAGSAPGVLPLFLFRYLLRGAVTLHKADLKIELPPLSQERAPVEARGEVLAEYERMLRALVDQIKADRFSGPEDGNLAGKLFGQLSELPSYLDRATVDVGNGRGARYEVRYPESVGGGLVTDGDLFPAGVLLPKEEALLDVAEAEVKAGRRLMVFGWHLELLPRLARLLADRLGAAVPILRADKVPTAKRQAWIDKNVVGKRVPAMVVNPVCVQTGLNNLTYFHTIWQHESPACNPIVDRQSLGRIDRIGAKLPTRIYRAYYGGTLQEKMYDLLMRKVAISTATDGLDPESAMLAAGVEPSEFVAGLSLGRALYAMVEQGAIEERPVLRLHRRAAR